jgi:hypothetical protein
MVFQDGIVVHLNEEDFVSKLASTHQAAPSEYQILTALIQEIENSQRNVPRISLSKNGETHWSKKKAAKSLVRHVVKNSPVQISCAIGVDFLSGNSNLTDRFYSSSIELATTSTEEPDRGLLMVLEVAPSIDQGGGAGSKPSKLYHELLSAAQNLDISVIHEAVVPPNCLDREAASIVAIQQFCYQNRVFGNVICKEKPQFSGVKRKLVI